MKYIGLALFGIVMALIVGFAISQVGCNNKPAVTAGINAGECILTHALAGESIVEIAIACAAPVEEVVVDILNAPSAAGTTAALEAQRARIVIQATPGEAVTGHGR